jgi:hypothetical protein
MATTAQMEANRRNAQKSTGPRTDEGKNRSRFNALDHGCRSRILVLPAETFGDHESELQAWRMSVKPRNPVQGILDRRDRERQGSDQADRSGPDGPAQYADV